MKPLPNVNEAKSRLNPAVYKEALSTVRLTSISLESLEMLKFSQISNIEAIDWKYTRDAGADLADPSNPLLDIVYVVNGSIAECIAITIKVIFREQFSAENCSNPDFFAIYADNSAQIQVWPYLRELVGNLCVRAGICNTVLPLHLSPQISDKAVDVSDVVETSDVSDGS